MYSRQAVVDLIKSWEGKKESDGSFKDIIDIYNSCPAAQLPRGIRMKYNWAWCACTWSALAIKLRYTNIMPIEISCAYLIERAKAMHIWVEQDSYVPSPGDAVLYDWQDNNVGDNTGVPDHVGTVVEVYEKAGYFVVIEGNHSDAVKRRTVAINGKFIRGFITPVYDDDVQVIEQPKPNKSIDTVAREVILNIWGSGEQRRYRLEKAGYNYTAVQTRVNEILNGNVPQVSCNATPDQPTSSKVTATEKAAAFDKSIAGKYTTASPLYLRNGAGTNKKALVKIPRSYVIDCYGYYSTFNGIPWYYIRASIDGVCYTGFSCSKYLTRT